MAILDRFRGPPTKDRFAAQLIAALKQAGDPRQAVYDQSEFRLVFSSDGESMGFANLDNHFGEHVRLPRAERASHLKGVVRGILSYAKELPDEFADAMPDIRIAVRSRFTFEYARLECQAEGREPWTNPCRQIGDHLGAYIVYDLPEATRYLHSSDLENWGISFQEAYEIGMQNLVESSFQYQALDGRTYASATFDTYDSSRLLMLDLIRQMDVQGRHLAMVPNRDVLLVAGEDDIEGQKIMLDLAEEAFAGPRPMCGVPLVLDGDDWDTWAPPPDHPLFNRVARLEMAQLGGDYEVQGGLLDAIHERQGLDIFVATFMSVENQQSGDAFSYSLWSKDVDALLPKAQRLMFFDPEKEIVAAASWDHVAKVVGHLMEPTDLYPPRFRVQEFPTDEELARIGLVGLPAD